MFDVLLARCRHLWMGRLDTKVEPWHDGTRGSNRPYIQLLSVIPFDPFFGWVEMGEGSDHG